LATLGDQIIEDRMRMRGCKAGQSKFLRRAQSQVKQRRLMLLKRSKTTKALLRTVQPRANSLVESASLKLSVAQQAMRLRVNTLRDHTGVARRARPT